jgi:hypothetical protein
VAARPILVWGIVEAMIVVNEVWGYGHHGACLDVKRSRVSRDVKGFCRVTKDDTCTTSVAKNRAEDRGSLEGDPAGITFALASKFACNEEGKE